MKILRLTSIYPVYVRQFYANRPGLEHASYAEQKAAFAADAFSSTGAWVSALNGQGSEAEEIIASVEPLQRAWARENGLKLDVDLRGVAVEQVKRYCPDVLWADSDDAELVKSLRDEGPRLKLILGWVGSALPPGPIWKHVDLTLSCAPEAVARLRALGMSAEHLDHAFDSRVLEHLAAREPRFDLSFIGQIVRGTEFHLERERILEALVDSVEIDVFSPTPEASVLRDYLRFFAKSGAWTAARFLTEARIPTAMLDRLPLVRNALHWRSPPALSVSPKLRGRIRSGVFGLEMFQLLRDSRIVLNIHADSSPTHASNMRLFETTGVGSCLLTDWRGNLAELFEVDKEIVAYRSPEECVEKVKWLLARPEARRSIAEAGQRRALRDHSIERRAEKLVLLVKEWMRNR